MDNGPPRETQALGTCRVERTMGARKLAPRYHHAVHLDRKSTRYHQVLVGILALLSIPTLVDCDIFLMLLLYVPIDLIPCLIHEGPTNRTEIQHPMLLRVEKLTDNGSFTAVGGVLLNHDNGPAIE